MVVEASPLEDCVPSGPVRMELKNVLYSTYPPNVFYFYLCDHNNDNPKPLYADKTYVMALADGFAHDWDENGAEAKFEYVPLEGPYSTQADVNGNRRPTDLTGDWIAEVTPGFYGTKEGQDWLLDWTYSQISVNPMISHMNRPLRSWGLNATCCSL